MSRHTFTAVAAAITLGVLLNVLSSTRAAGRQSAVPRTLNLNNPITYFIADGSGEPGYRSSDRELARWAMEAWQRAAMGDLQFEAVAESSALVRLYWAGPDSGEYGETQPITVGGRRGAAIFTRPDVESLGPDIARRARGDVLLRDTIVYLTCLHELGHALGLAHTRDFRDIMYYFGYGGDIVQYFDRYRAQLRARKDIETLSGLSAADISRIRTMYPSK